MSLAATIMARLGLDTKGFSDGMKRANTALERHEQAIRRTSGAHDNLFRSSHRVATQIHTVARDLAAGASAGDVFSASIEGLGRSMNLSLGALAGLAVGAVVVQKIFAVRAEFQKLTDDLAKLKKEASTSTQFQSISALEGEAKRADKILEELAERQKQRSKEGGFFGPMTQFFKDWSKHPFRPSEAQSRAEDSSEADQADRIKEAANAAALAKGHARIDIAREGLAGAPGYESKAKLLKIASDEERAGKSFGELALISDKLKLAFQELAASVNDKKANRAGMTLKELAEMVPDVVGGGVSYEKYKTSKDARKAMALEAAGDAARANFDPEGAHENFNQAGAIEEGMYDLKPSEKMNNDFKGALVVTEGYLKTISEKPPFVNR